MKTWHSLFFVFILLMMTSCHKVGDYTYNIENRLPYPVEVRFETRSLIDTAQVNSNTVKTIFDEGSKALNQDIYYDSLYVFYFLNIYRADTLLIKRSMTARKEWIFSQTGDKDATYLLIIDQDDLK
jgi:hypothetical protein